MARESDRALEQANKAIELDPNSHMVVASLALAYEQKGDYKNRMVQRVRSQELRGRHARAEELRKAFEKSGYKGYLRKDALYECVASNYAVVGEKDGAFAALEKAFATRSQMLLIKADPNLDNIRSGPRYGDLLCRMGLPQ